MRNPEAESPEPAPLDEREQLRKDLSYSPASEAETAAKQEDPPETPDDVDADAVRLAPGTGGPDDAGDVEVDRDDLRMPQDRDDEVDDL